MATGLTDATIRVSADTRAMERDIAKSLRTVELSQINTKKSSQALGRITGQVSEFNKSLEASNARVIAFGASAGAIFAVERAIGSLITTTIEVEKKLQDVNVLLNLSSANLEKFGSSLFNIARNTAQSFTSVADAATELARQGLGVEETLRRTNAALILARLSGLDTVKSVEALTATINSFSNSALDATQIVNKLANVDAAFAVSSADLANAISRVGSTAQDAGVSLDELISIVTAAQQTTARGGAVIGNSLKTIFTRLQRGKVQSLLESLGVDTGEGQSAVSLLQQLASVYDELSASQKSYVAEQVGGVFQINILKAALGDLGKQYSIYGRALDTSLSSTDQAIRRNEELNKTVAALSTQAVANLQQAADKIGSIVFEPNAKNFLSSINQLLESFNNIDAESQGGKFIEGFFKGISNFIGGPGTVLAVAVLTKLFVKLTQFAAGSARELLGRNEATKQQAALEQSVLSILQKNTQFTNQILSGKLSTVQAEKQLLSYLTAQSNIMKEQERLSKVIGGNLGRAGFTVSSKGIPTAPKSKSAGFVPNFASERAVGQVMEDIGAKQHGYKAGKARKTRIHDGNGKSFSSFVNSREDVVNFRNADGKRATIVRPPNGFGENTEFAAGGFMPNFAKNHSFTVGDFSGGKGNIKNPNAGRELTKGIKSNKNIEKDDKISSVGFKIEEIPVPDKLKSEITSAEKPIRQKAELDFEALAIKALRYRPGNTDLYGGKRSAVDGYKFSEGNKLINLLEVKAGGWDTLSVANKFGRFIPENIFKSRDPMVSKSIQNLFGEGVLNEWDTINLKNTLAVPYFGIGEKSSVKLDERGEKILSYSGFRKGDIANTIKDISKAEKIRRQNKKNKKEASLMKQEAASFGFIPNFAGAKMQGLYKMRMAGATEAERAASTFRSGSSKEAELKKGRVNVQNLGSLPYTMIHPGNEGLLSSGEIDFLKKDKKTGKPTRYFAKFNTSGLSSSEIAKQANASALQDRVSNYLLGEANQFARIFNPSASFSNIGQFSDRGAVMTAVGTVFESAIRKAFNQEAASKNQDFDFPAPNQQLREFFGNAPGPYEAKGSKTLPNLQSSLEKWVRSKGLAGGFIPNFASGIVTGDVLRGNEYKAVLDYLAKTSKPIRTILGPSGSGKTTMASNLGGKIVKSFKDLDVYSDYILDRSMLSFPKDPMVAESLKKIYSKSSQANALDLIVGSRNTIKSLREKRAAEGDQFIPGRSQLPTGSGGIGSFTKGVRDFASQYPGSSVSRIFKKGGSYGARKILSKGFIPNFAGKSLSATAGMGSFLYADLFASKKGGRLEIESMGRGGFPSKTDPASGKRSVSNILYTNLIESAKKQIAKSKNIKDWNSVPIEIIGELLPQDGNVAYPQGISRLKIAKKAIGDLSMEDNAGREINKKLNKEQLLKLLTDKTQQDSLRSSLLNLKTQHAAGFVPNFAYKIEKATGGISPGERSIKHKESGSYARYAKGKDPELLDIKYIQSYQKGQGLEMFNRLGKIARRSGKKLHSSILISQKEKLDSLNPESSSLEQILKTAYPQLLYRQRSNVKNTDLQFLYYSKVGSAMKSLSGRDSFSLVLDEVKKIHANPGGGPAALIEDIRTSNMGISKVEDTFAKGFVPNFAQISQIMALESAMSGEKATFHSKPFPHVRNKSQPTFGSAMADHGGLNNALKDSVKGQKSAGLLSGGFIPNFADGVSSEDSSAAFAGILAGLQGIGFTALFLGKEMREAANNIKTAKKDIKDFGTTIQKTEAQTERIEKRKARLEKVAPTLTRNADINQARGNVASAIKLQREAKKTGSEADIEAANKLLANERRKLTKAENALKSKIQQRISSIDQSIQSNRQLINEQRNEVNERRKAIAQMRSQSRSSMLSQGGMIAQILAPQAASFIPQDTQGGRGAAAGVEALGNIAGMAGTGALIGGPIGAAAGAAVAALLEIPKIEKAFTSKMPELEKAVTAATESFTKFSEGGQVFLSASEKLSTIKADPNASSQDIIGAEQQYANALAALPTKYQDQLVAAERLGNAQQVYTQVLEELGREKQGAETIANTRKVFENNKTGLLGKIGDAGLMAALQAAGGINTLTGGLATGFQMDFSDFENQINTIDYQSRYGRSVSQEDMGSLVGQTYGFTRVSDDSTTAVNEALNAAKNFAQNLEKVQLGINKEGGVNEANFESQKSALTSALRAAFSESGGTLDSNELGILEQLSSAINRPDQLETWLSKYQSENNQFISAQEKIAEVNKAIAERQKKEAERVAKEKARADQRGARISAAGANMDRVFKDFSYALEEALSKIDFAGQLEKNRGQFAAEIYDAVNLPNAARNRKEQNQLFEITNTANLDREKLKSGAAKDIFTNIGDAITSASLNESVVSAMSDTEKTAAIQDFDLAKLGFKNELMGSGALDKILKGDTTGASKDINALIDKMAASGNFTATQIQDLKNKTINELNAVEAGIKTSNKNEQQQKALLAQQLVQERVKERITGAQNFGGGYEDMINSLLGSPESLFNKASDALASAVGGGFDVRNLKEDSDGKVVNSKTGEKIAKDQAGAAANFYDMITQYAGAPVTSMDDIGIKAISQARNDQLYSQVDQLEKQAGGAFGPEVFQNIRKRLDEDLGGKNGEVGKLQALKRFGSIDGDQYINKLTSKYKDEAFKDLPSELQAAYKAASGDTSLQLLAINKLTEVSKTGFGNVETAIKGQFNINKISEGIKAGLIANKIAEKKIAAEENAADSRLALSDAESNLDKNKEKLKTSEEKFKSSALELNTQFDRYGKKGFYNASSESFWNNSEEIKKLEDNFSSENIQMARTQLGAGQSVDQNRLFLDQAEAFNKAKSLRAEMMVARKNVSQSESDIVSAKGKANAAAALVQDYKSVSTDQAGLDKMTQLYSENKDLAGKGFFTPGQNYMNAALLPKQPPIAPPTSPAQPSPIQQALTTGGAAGGAIMQPNLNTTVGSINVPVSITMPAQAAAMQSFQETQAAAFDQSVEQLRSEVQALAQKFASTQTELQNKGVVSPKPPTTPAVKPAGVAPK